MIDARRRPARLFLPASRQTQKRSVKADGYYIAVGVTEFVARPVADEAEFIRDRDLGTAAQVQVTVVRRGPCNGVDQGVAVPEETRRRERIA